MRAGLTKWDGYGGRALSDDVVDAALLAIFGPLLDPDSPEMKKTFRNAEKGLESLSGTDPKAITLTADYQFVINPAFNADRGPVHIFSGRLHGEF